MKRRCELPFGAEPLADGRVRFRLWAPSATSVEVLIEGAASHALPMQAQPHGAFELTTQEAKVGTRYRYRIDGQLVVPDPMSRANPDDVQGASQVVDPESFDWPDGDWTGRPWHTALIYELHIGTFSPEGTFAGAIARLDYLVQLGITAIELMPVANFPGGRGWGYDGVLSFAPKNSYGTPDDLKRLVAAAHARGLMILLDVVYNHFGPEGNYLGAYAASFFTERHHTPWGAAIDYHQKQVREFAIENARYWLEEFNFDGLRLDAVHAIRDDSTLHVLDELAQRVRRGLGAHRQVHLILENEDNSAHYLGTAYDAQWNDDLHHALHVVASGETDGYYADYAHTPLATLGRCLAEGFAYQGDASVFRQGALRGETSRHLPPTAFISFTQNHDQIGNRAFGDRLIDIAPRAAVEAVVAIQLLAPQIPMLFMGEEFGAATPFQYFCDYTGELGVAITNGRRKEFAGFFARFAESEKVNRIPDPNAVSTFEASKLHWPSVERDEHAAWLQFYRTLIDIRTREVVPRLAGISGDHAYRLIGEGGLEVRWKMGDGSTLVLDAQLSDVPAQRAPVTGRVIYALRQGAAQERAPWSLIWSVLTP